MNDNEDIPVAKRPRLHRKCKSPIEASQLTGKAVQRKPRKINATSLKMMDMNDHCLLEIMERMELRDLCTMAETCVRLKKLAQKFFATKYRQMSLTQLADPINGKCTMSKIRQLLYNFGPLIKCLTFDYKILHRMNTDKTSQEEILVFAFVRKYCFDTIDEMIIYNDYFNESDGAVPIVLKNIQKIIIFSFGSMMFLKKVPAENDSDDSKSKMVFQRSKSTAAQKTGAPE